MESGSGKSVVQIRWNKEENITDEEYFNLKNYMDPDLGNTDPEDGYKYRGAGYIQLTGRYNYNEFSKAMNDPLIFEEGTSYVAENYAWEASGWFWMTFVHGVFEENENPTVNEVTVKINSSCTHLERREEMYNIITKYDQFQGE